MAIAVNARLGTAGAGLCPVRTGTLLDEISSQVDDALETLRALARGIFPPVLADRGLVPALRAHLAGLHPLHTWMPTPRSHVPASTRVSSPHCTSAAWKRCRMRPNMRWTLGHACTSARIPSG